MIAVHGNARTGCGPRNGAWSAARAPTRTGAPIGTSGARHELANGWRRGRRLCHAGLARRARAGAVCRRGTACEALRDRRLRPHREGVSGRLAASRRPAFGTPRRPPPAYPRALAVGPGGSATDARRSARVGCDGDRPGLALRCGSRNGTTGQPGHQATAGIEAPRRKRRRGDPAAPGDEAVARLPGCGRPRFTSAFPVAPRLALQRLAAGQDPGGSAIIVLRPVRNRATARVPSGATSDDGQAGQSPPVALRGTEAD